MKNDVTVVIMAHNRVETIGEAIDSVLLQKDVKIVVSDNSSSDCVKNFVALNYPTIHYFQRKNYPDSSSHFNAILTSINSKYFMIFHDDDILIEGSIKIMVNALEDNSSISAVSGNAYVIEGKNKTNKSLVSKNHSTVINNKQEMAEKYILPESHGVAPFPGYLYRTSMVSNIVSDPSEGGKHADISFLMKVVEAGKVLWLKDYIMFYRIHDKNDSSIENISDRLSIIRYIKRNTKLKSKNFSYYKFIFYMKFLRQNYSFMRFFFSYKYKSILFFVIKFGVLMVLRNPNLLKKIIHKAWRLL